MRKLLLMLSVVALIGLGPVRPILHSFWPVLDPGIAHAQNDNDQGEDNDDQGEDEQ